MTLSHNGNDSAPAAKYRPKNIGSMALLACKRSCTKNSTKVAGTALAKPFSTNTINKRRKPACFHGCHKVVASAEVPSGDAFCAVFCAAFCKA